MSIAIGAKGKPVNPAEIDHRCLHVLNIRHTYYENKQGAPIVH